MSGADDHRDMLELRRRSLLAGAGLRKTDLDKPLVAVISAWGEIGPGQAHLRDLALAARDGVLAAGGQPAELAVPGVCASSSLSRRRFQYKFPYRDLAAGLIDLYLNLYGFEAAVLIPSCDDAVPGYLMGAAMADLPVVFLTGGHMAAGEHEGKPIFTNAVQIGFSQWKGGRLERKTLEQYVERVCPGAGQCPHMATATTMSAVVETLGLSPAGNTTLAATGGALRREARSAGERVMALLREKRSAREFMTRTAMEDAIRVVLTLGGSLNAVLHLSALAQVLKLEMPLTRWDELSRTTPLTAMLRPNTTEAVTAADLGRAGGIPAVLKNLGLLIHGDRPTVMGPCVAEIAAAAPAPEGRVLRPIEDPFAPEGGLAVLTGNLAPEGALLKQSALPRGFSKLEGPARVYDSEISATEAVLAGDIQAGDILVVRGQGPQGAPGVNELIDVMHAIVGRGLIETTAVVTDGRFSGGNYGCAVGHVSPEAFAGGPIAAVRQGDRLRIDLEARKLDVDLSPETLSLRLSESDMGYGEAPGILGLYRRLTGSLSVGGGTIWSCV